MRGQFAQRSRRIAVHSCVVKQIGFAVESTTTSTVTAATYSSQVATYNTSLFTFDTATATFKIQAAAYATVVQVYKTSYNNALFTYKAILKANFPLTTTAQYAVLVAAYNTAMTSYNAATVTFKAKIGVYQAALATYKASYSAISQSFKTVSKSREQLKKSISISFNSSVHSANVAFAAAKASATNAAQKTAAIKVRHVAVLAAIATRSAARVALGAKPNSPIQQIKIGQKADAFKALRPVRPVKSA